MKTRIFLMLLLMVAFVFSCQKEKEPVATDQEVTFSATIVTDDLKNTEADTIPPCVLTVTPTHAHMIINGVAYDPQVFQIGNKWYTQAIKLPVGGYSMTQFFLYKDNAPAGYGTGDVIVYATPESGPYLIYLTHILPRTFNVTAFTKIELDVEVLCFLNLEYEAFGFFWFDITEIIIKEACFFGDLCLVDLELWDEEWPYMLGGGVFVDEEAYIQVEVFVNGSPTPLTTWTNQSTYFGTVPLCVEYPDVVGFDDIVMFKVSVWVPINAGPPVVFGWVHYGTFFAMADALDQQGIVEAGLDNVVDFVIYDPLYGTCSPQSYPQWPWLGPLH